MHFSLIVPAFNEETRIANALESYYSECKKLCSFEIIVVANGCIDSTVQIIKEFSKKHSRTKLVEVREKLGKGGAIIRGFREASGRNLGFIDADDSFDFTSVGKLLKELQKCDCVIASKWKGQKFSEVREDFLRKVLSRSWNFLTKKLLGLEFNDTQAGFKLLKSSAWKGIDSKFNCTGFAFDVELLLKLERKGLNVKEVFVKSVAVKDSKFSLLNIPSMFFDLLRLWRDYH